MSLLKELTWPFWAWVVVAAAFVGAFLPTGLQAALGGVVGLAVVAALALNHQQVMGAVLKKRHPGNYLGWAVFAALFVCGLPNVLGSFAFSICLTVMIYAIFALGLNIVIGYTGLLDLGYASFMALGAFTVALGLVLTDQPAEPFPDMAISKLALTQDQRQLEPAAGEQVVVRRRPGGSFDVVSGAPAVLQAKAEGHTTIACVHEEGLVLPVGQRTAQGEQVFGFKGGFFLLILVGGILCALAGLVRGYPTLNLTGDYYAIVTLGFAEIVWLVTLNEEWLTGGAFGVKLALQYRPEIAGEPLYADTWQYYYTVYGALLIAMLICYCLQHSRLGRAWAAIKADETAAASSGINVKRAKMLAFAASGFVGGIAGALFAIKLETVTAKQFDIWQSILVVCCLVLGGMGTIRGALVGAVGLMGLGEILRLLSDPSNIPEFVRAACRALGWSEALRPEARFLVYGLILVLVMRFRPQGLLPPKGHREPLPEDELAELSSRPSHLYALQPVAAAPEDPAAGAGDAS